MNIDELLEEAKKLDIKMPKSNKMSDEEIDKIAQELESLLDSKIDEKEIKTNKELKTEIEKVAEIKAIEEARFNISILKKLNENGYIEKLASFKEKALENKYPEEEIDELIKVAVFGLLARGIARPLAKGTRAAAKGVKRGVLTPLGESWQYSKKRWGQEWAGKKPVSKAQWLREEAKKKEITGRLAERLGSEKGVKKALKTQAKTRAELPQLGKKRTAVQKSIERAAKRGKGPGVYTPKPAAIAGPLAAAKGLAQRGLAVAKKHPITTGLVGGALTAGAVRALPSDGTQPQVAYGQYPEDVYTQGYHPYYG